MSSDRPNGVLAHEGDVLGDRYRLLSKLGTGGSARVFLAEDQRLGRHVAVKVLHPRPGAPAPARIEREARQAAALSHPNVVQIHDVVIEEDDAYIVMEHVAGTPLDELLREEGPCTEERTVELGLMVASALEAAHAQGIVHRDVKPSNVLIRPDGTAKLADFGTARMGGGDTLTDEGTLIGSAAYVAPEQVRAGVVDHRADLYGLGILLYEAVTGERPFVGDSVAATVIQRLHRDPPPPSAHRDVSPALEAVILRAMAREPDDRYPDAAAVAADLRSIAVRPYDVTQPIPSPLPTAHRRRRLHRVLGGSALGVTLLVGAALASGWGSAVGTPEDAIVTGTLTAAVPELRGMTLEAATRKAEAAGFEIRSVREVPATSTAGTVVDQVPGAGVELPPDGGIALLVSAGPGMTPTTEPEDADPGAGAQDTTGGATASDPQPQPQPEPDPEPEPQPEPAPDAKTPQGKGPPDEPGSRGKGNGNG